MYFHFFDKSNFITGAIHCTISLQQSSQLLAILIPWLLLRLTSTFVIVIIRCSIIINVIMDFYRKSSPIHSDSRYVSSSDLVKTTLSGNGIHFSAQPTSQDIGSVNECQWKTSSEECSQFWPVKPTHEHVKMVLLNYWFRCWKADQKIKRSVSDLNI